MSVHRSFRMNIWDVFDEKNNLIKEYKYWKLLIRNKQVRLGSCVAILKREAFPLGKVNEQEMAEYAKIARELENALEKCFQPKWLYHMVLMFKDKQIHFHLIPRYGDQKRQFANIEWVDDNQPDPFSQKMKE